MTATDGELTPAEATSLRDAVLAAGEDSWNIPGDRVYLWRHLVAWLWEADPDRARELATICAGLSARWSSVATKPSLRISCSSVEGVPPGCAA
jgi:hypothetical protein